jgi:hypothetical protein
VWGSRSDAIGLRKDIEIFLKDLKLDLSIEKTLITNARAERAKFLGVYIERMAPSIGGPLVKEVRGKSKRIPTGNTWMTAPLASITKRLVEKKFLKIEKDRWIPLSLPELIPLPLKDIILRYRTVLNGFLNYYSFVDNLNKLKKIF